MENKYNTDIVAYHSKIAKQAIHHESSRLILLEYRMKLYGKLHASNVIKFVCSINGWPLAYSELTWLNCPGSKPNVNSLLTFCGILQAYLVDFVCDTQC